MGAEEFGPYVVYEQLGKGGMATVHRAETQGIAGFSKQVALKRMLPTVAADANLVKSFIREAQLASHLRHANVAQTYDLGKVGDTYFIAMELVPGRNLREVLKHCAANQTPVPLPIAMNIVNQICDALDYAHNLCDESGQPLGIIHRDVSPANVILGEGGIVKLIDFGIAKASSRSDMQTQSGMIKGKFGYMAPEYLMGYIDARADLFALGVIAHELLSNKPLFQGKDDMQTLYNVKDMAILAPSRFNPAVPPEIDAIVLTALERDPNKRWQTATALRSALTKETQRLGLVAHNSAVHDWIEQAFADSSGDHAPEIAVGGGSTVELSKGSVEFLQPAGASATPLVAAKGSQPLQQQDISEAIQEGDWNAASAAMTNLTRPKSSEPVPREFLKDHAPTVQDRPSQQLNAMLKAPSVPVKQPGRNIVKRTGFEEESPTRADALAIDSLAASTLARREDAFESSAHSEKTTIGAPSQEAMALLTGKSPMLPRAQSVTEVDGGRAESIGDGGDAFLDGVSTAPGAGRKHTASEFRDKQQTSPDRKQRSEPMAAVSNIPDIDDIPIKPPRRPTPPALRAPSPPPRRPTPAPMPAYRPTPMPMPAQRPTPPAMTAVRPTTPARGLRAASPQDGQRTALGPGNALPFASMPSGARTQPRLPATADPIGEVLSDLEDHSSVASTPKAAQAADAASVLPSAPRSVGSNLLLMLIVLVVAGVAAAVVYFALPFLT